MAGTDKVNVADGSQEQPFTIDDEDHDIPKSGVGLEVERIVWQIQKGDAFVNPIDLDKDDEELSEDPWRFEEEKYDLDIAKIESETTQTESEGHQDGPCAHWKKAVRNPCLCGTHSRVATSTMGVIELCKSQVVELKDHVRVGRYEAEFVEIHEIWVPIKDGQSFIRGWAYARTRNLEGRIEPRKNEVCALFEIDTDDHRAANPLESLEQALIEVPFGNVKKTRILHKTNKAFPECRFDPVRYRTPEEREDHAPLTCRWCMTMHYPHSGYRQKQRPVDGEEIRHYSFEDVPKGRHRVPDSVRREESLTARGKTRGGSFIPNGAPKADPGSSRIHQAPGQKYTVVDVFCGAGGYSKGAEMAGLKVLAACDHWPRCCETYRHNFPETELHEKDVFRYIQDLATNLTADRPNVDILHHSPPCQTYSPAHTCPGKHDVENRTALYACEQIIAILRPRLCTIEQTFGLAQERWIPVFNALIRGITRLGFSVKWKVIPLVEFGLPQTRKRLIIVGAAPGEQLPDWPRPTHSKEPQKGQKPLVSAFRACVGLVDGENLHDVDGARSLNRAVWDSGKPLERTITTSGGQCYHWSGQRELTLAEFAKLQGFPGTYQFVSKCIKKQIGNAFPPVVVKNILKHFRKHLEEADGVVHVPEPGAIIEISDDKVEKLVDNNQTGRDALEEFMKTSRRQSYSHADFSLHRQSSIDPRLLQGIIDTARQSPILCFLAGTRKNNPKAKDTADEDTPNAPRQGSLTAPNDVNRASLPAQTIRAGLISKPVCPSRSGPNDATAGDEPESVDRIAFDKVLRATHGSTIHAEQVEKYRLERGESVVGPGRRRSSGDSVMCTGESSRAGATRELPITLEDQDGEEEEINAGERLQQQQASASETRSKRSEEVKRRRGTARCRDSKEGNQDKAQWFDLEERDEGHWSHSQNGLPAPDYWKISLKPVHEGIKAGLPHSEQAHPAEDNCLEVPSQPDVLAGPSNPGDEIPIISTDAFLEKVSNILEDNPTAPLLVDQEEPRRDFDPEELALAMKLSMLDAPQPQPGIVGDKIKEGSTAHDMELAMKGSVRDTLLVDQTFQKVGGEVLNSSMDAKPMRQYGRSSTREERTGGREMHGPGDNKGKGKAVGRRRFDKFDEDYDAPKCGSSSKRPRSSI